MQNIYKRHNFVTRSDIRAFNYLVNYNNGILHNRYTFTSRCLKFHLLINHNKRNELFCRA
jgi:hypothetical protein